MAFSNEEIRKALQEEARGTSTDQPLRFLVTPTKRSEEAARKGTPQQEEK
jgi:hypothetical protein